MTTTPFADPNSVDIALEAYSAANPDSPPIVGAVLHFEGTAPSAKRLREQVAARASDFPPLTHDLVRTGRCWRWRPHRLDPANHVRDRRLAPDSDLEAEVRGERHFAQRREGAAVAAVVVRAQQAVAAGVANELEERTQALGIVEVRDGRVVAVGRAAGERRQFALDGRAARDGNGDVGRRRLIARWWPARVPAGTAADPFRMRPGRDSTTTASPSSS